MAAEVDLSTDSQLFTINACKTQALGVTCIMAATSAAAAIALQTLSLCTAGSVHRMRSIHFTAALSSCPYSLPGTMTHGCSLQLLTCVAMCMTPGVEVCHRSALCTVAALGTNAIAHFDNDLANCVTPSIHTHDAQQSAEQHCPHTTCMTKQDLLLLAQSRWHALLCLIVCLQQFAIAAANSCVFNLQCAETVIC